MMKRRKSSPVRTKLRKTLLKKRAKYLKKNLPDLLLKEAESPEKK